MEFKRPLYIPFAGPALLEAPLLNKGSAFSEDERNAFNLTGLLPHNIESISEQSARAYQQLAAFQSDLEKHIYLRNIQDTNETLFFHLIDEHLEEIMPLIYTPTVGLACEKFSQIYRRKRGLFISYPERDKIDDMLQNATKQNVKVIVVTDGERILGLGDQGIGGMGIPVGKLALYTACGGISPAYCLPIVLDVGTNNKTLLSDPMYMGWRHNRISGEQYDNFVELFIDAVKRRWPNVLLQFEDFAKGNATPLLNKYRNELCCFNDDIQGTAAVSVGTLLAACQKKGEKISEQRFAFLGGGSAGCGIAEHIIRQMMLEGLSDDEARKQIFIIGRYGLLTSDMTDLQDFQEALSQEKKSLVNWDFSSQLGLEEVIKQAKITVLIGVSGQPGLFTQTIIKQLAKNTERPIVLPLSNPTSMTEGKPQDIMDWTDGKALVATGSPFPPSEYNGERFTVSQCNNSYIFPGVGLGVLASKATGVSDNMLMAASQSLADAAMDYNQEKGALLPPLSEIKSISKSIAYAVAQQAIADGLALPASNETMQRRLQENFWEAEYRPYRRTSF